MASMRRYIAAQYASRAIPQYTKECRHIVTKIEGNVYFISLKLPLDQVTIHLDTLETTEQATLTGARDAFGVRDTALLVVRGDMRHLKSAVQLVADADMTHAKEIIESAGMYVSMRASVAKPDLAARYGASPGLVRLDAKALTGRAAYYWQMNDQKTWIDLPPTVKASTTVSGLTPVTLYSFRYRTLSNVGFSDWSMEVSIIAQ